MPKVWRSVSVRRRPSLASALVCKSDPGVVVRADGRVDLMCWGFHRESNPSINNARSDKLEGRM